MQFLFNMIDNRLYHYNTLKSYNDFLYSTLIYEHHVISDTMQEIQVITGLAQGYFAKKNKLLYMIDRETLKALPIRIKGYTEEIDGKKVFYLVNQATSFKITPVKTKSFRELIDNFATFEHTNPEDFKLFKIISMASYCSRTFTRISTHPGFGKDSIKGILQHLTDKVRVIDPRTPSAIMRELTADGEIVINEVCGKKAEIKDLIQDIILNLGAGSVTYTNGALQSASHKTKDKYDVNKLSITAMYNTLEDYDNKDNFFDYQFKNNNAVNDRLLPIRLNGILTQRFDLDFDYHKLMEENKLVLQDLVKNIEYWKVNWQQELHPYFPPHTTIQGRHKQTVDILFSFINLYSKDQEEHVNLCKLLLTRIEDYYKMLRNERISHENTPNSNDNELGATLPLPKEDKPKKAQKSLFMMETNTPYTYNDLIEIHGLNDQKIDRMMEEGTIFEIRPAVFMRF